jgi:hypothetical protein
VCCIQFIRVFVGLRDRTPSRAGPSRRIESAILTDAILRPPVSVAGVTLVLVTLEVLLQRADAAMYRSRQAERNRVTTWEISAG